MSDMGLDEEDERGEQEDDDRKVITLNIEKLSERKKTLNVMIYGEPGVGKTTFAATAPRPMLWLEAEGGTHSIADTEGIDIVKVNKLADYREVLRYAHANPDAYETYVIDSMTETQASILKEIMRAVARADSDRNEFMPQFAEWGQVTGMMREIARAFRDIPSHTVITALTREDRDDLTGKTRVRPRMTPALAEELPAFMDACLFMYASTPQKGEADDQGIMGDEEGVTVVRNALLQPTGKYTAKIRAPKGTKVPDFITDPTFEAVANYVLVP
jgi:phage nucleotide-binding protein